MFDGAFPYAGDAPRLLRRWPLYLMALLLGFFTGYWASYGSIVTENFPTRIRSTGTTYNLARAISFVGPVPIARFALLEIR